MACSWRSPPSPRRGAEWNTTTRSGPFLAAEDAFFVETNLEKFSHRVDEHLRDLRVSSDDGGERRRRSAGSCAPARRGSPTHGSCGREGEPCETQPTDDYVLPYRLWEITRLVLEGVGSLPEPNPAVETAFLRTEPSSTTSAPVACTISTRPRSRCGC